MSDINWFKNEHRFLSNFVPVEVKLDGVTYPSVEHAYVAAKTLDLSLREKIRIIPTSGKVKRFGRKLVLRQDWEDVKFDVMSSLLRQKFLQEPFRTLLLETGESYLREGNYWSDRVWGCTLDPKTNTWVGENNLGIMLMRIRDHLSLQVHTNKEVAISKNI